jgi:hypothetical protein
MKNLTDAIYERYSDMIDSISTSPLQSSSFILTESDILIHIPTNNSPRLRGLFFLSMNWKIFWINYFLFN